MHSCTAKGATLLNSGNAMVVTTMNVHDTMRLYTLSRALLLLNSTIR